MKKVIQVLVGQKETLQAIITERGENQVSGRPPAPAWPDCARYTWLFAALSLQQLKMQKLIPALNETLGGPMQEAGFPPPPMGTMQGVMAFTQASALEGGECIKEGVDMLKAALMGNFPSQEKLAEITSKLE